MTEELKNFTRLKNGDIIYVEKKVKKQKFIIGFTFKSRVLKLKRYKADEIDETWSEIEYKQKLEILKTHFKSLDYYDLNSSKYHSPEVTKERHSKLANVIILQPHISSLKETKTDPK
ncbi:MAG: hypothetical protein V4504_01150 [Patescibacteria group bacterium]